MKDRIGLFVFFSSSFIFRCNVFAQMIYICNGKNHIIMNADEFITHNQKRYYYFGDLVTKYFRRVIF